LALAALRKEADMNTLICAGGSGVRVLEALLHLCAAGLGPASLRLLVIDPDGANGNGARVTGLVESYLEGHRRFANRLGDLHLFRTELDLLDVGGRSAGLKTWSPIEKGQRLREVLNVDLLDSTSTPPELVRLFFTSEEINMDLTQGFRGHPSVGAAAMSLVALKTGEQPWRQLVEKLRGDLARDEGARVFLAGSVFGGTGAATFYPIARFLRTVPEVNHARLKVAAGALSPYFRFESASAGAGSQASRQAAKAERFPLATRSAVDFYEHLRLNAVEDSWPFDAFYWVGDDAPLSVPYAPGGPNQKNPSHFVELLTALAVLDFFQAPGEVQGSCYAASNGGPDEELSLDWRDLPLARLDREKIRRSLLRFFLAGTVHLGFSGPLVRLPEIETQSYRVPWYWERFASKGDRLSTETSRSGLDFLDRFFREHHFSWWLDVHGRDAVRLFNRSALDGKGEVRLDRLTNLLWPDRAGESDPDAIDSFYSEMMKVPKKRGGESGAAAYLALLTHAADRFIDSHYTKTGSKE
jgi:hypothetical protein